MRNFCVNFFGLGQRLGRSDRHPGRHLPQPCAKLSPAVHYAPPVVSADEWIRVSVLLLRTASGAEPNSEFQARADLRLPDGKVGEGADAVLREAVEVVDVLAAPGFAVLL